MSSVLIPLLLGAALITGAIATTAGVLPTPNGAVDLAIQHRLWARGASAIAIGLLAWISVKYPRLRKLAPLLILGIVLESALGEMPNGVVGWGGLVHATLAQILLAGAVALVVQLLPDWQREPQIVQDYGWPSLRSLARLLPVLVVLQVALGAGFRHHLSGLMPHIAGAMIVSIFILIVAAFVLQQAKDHQPLNLWARAMMVLTVIQVFLGIGVFTVRSMPETDTNVVLGTAAAHILNGALVLSASTVLGMQIRKHVRPKPKA